MRAWVLLLLWIGGDIRLTAQWDPARFRGLVMEKLAERARQTDHLFCDSEDCKPQHEILSELDLPYKNRKSKLMVTATSDPQHNCHACGASLSLFEFELRNGVWALTDSQFSVLEWGQFGGAYRQGISVQALGDQLYGVFLEGGSVNQGIVEKFTNVLARVEREFSLVLRVQTGEDATAGFAGPEGDNWSASVSVARSGQGVRDLLVGSEGVREGKKFRQTDRYRFDGKEYQQVF